MLALATIAPVVFVWGAVVRTMSAPPPPARTGEQPEALVWAGRVFAGRSQLEAWLRSRGTSYEAWARTHAAAAAVVEHRAPPATTTSHAALAASATPKHHAASTAPKHPAATATKTAREAPAKPKPATAKATPAPSAAQQPPAPARQTETVSAAGATATRSSRRLGVSTIGWILVAVLLAAAAVPRRLLVSRRFQLGPGVPEFRLYTASAAGAVALALFVSHLGG